MSRRTLSALAAIASTLVSCASSTHAPPRNAESARAPTSRANIASTPAYAMRETPDAPFRSSAPPLADATPFTAPPIRAFHLANGVPVLFLEQHSPAFLRVEVLLHAQPAPVGANAMAARCLWLGTQTVSQVQLEAANDAEFAQMASSFAWSSIRVAMTATSDRAASSIARLAEVVLSPRSLQIKSSA